MSILPWMACVSYLHALAVQGSLRALAMRSSAGIAPCRVLLLTQANSYSIAVHQVHPHSPDRGTSVRTSQTLWYSPCRSFSAAADMVRYLFWEARIMRPFESISKNTKRLTKTSDDSLKKPTSNLSRQSAELRTLYIQQLCMTMLRMRTASYTTLRRQQCQYSSLPPSLGRWDIRHKR